MGCYTAGTASQWCFRGIPRRPSADSPAGRARIPRRPGGICHLGSAPCWDPDEACRTVGTRWPAWRRARRTRAVGRGRDQRAGRTRHAALRGSAAGAVPSSPCAGLTRGARLRRRTRSALHRGRQRHGLRRADRRADPGAASSRPRASSAARSAASRPSTDAASGPTTSIASSRTAPSRCRSATWRAPCPSATPARRRASSGPTRTDRRAAPHCGPRRDRRSRWLMGFGCTALRDAPEPSTSPRLARRDPPIRSVGAAFRHTQVRTTARWARRPWPSTRDTASARGRWGVSARRPVRRVLSRGPRRAR